MEGSRKYILDKFLEHLEDSFENFCARHDIESNSSQLVTFLIDQDLIAPTNLQKFTIQREFAKISAEQNGPKTQMVGTLASRFSISERTVWTMLKENKPSKK